MFASLFHVSDGSGGSDFAEHSDAVLELGASVATWFRPNLAGFALVYAISLSGLFQVCRQGSATSLFSVPYRSLVYTSSLSSTPPDLGQQHSQAAQPLRTMTFARFSALAVTLRSLMVQPNTASRDEAPVALASLFSARPVVLLALRRPG